MNELQLYLLAIGVVAILAVLGFNRWQEHKYRRQAEQRFPPGRDDVLLAESGPSERMEPVLDSPLPPEPDEAEPGQDISPAWEASETLGPETAAPDDLSARPVQPVPEISEPQAGDIAPDPATEYVITLNASDPITAHALVLILQQLKSAGKAVRWLGLRNHHDHWEEIAQASPGAEFVKLAACLQLADRNGPLRSDEVNGFCDMVQAVAANLYAVMDCPDKQAALAAAVELDQFCAGVDVLIGVNIISRDGVPFAGTKLRGLAESAGMRLMPDGLFHYFDDQGADLFALGNLDPTPFSAESMKHISTHGVTFIFDVPKATGGVQAFNQMLLAARQFAVRLSALMVDDNRKELSDAGIDRIRQQLAAIYATMEAHRIHPGSAQAGRLFA
ncbi:MAG: cell division protein ZipA C-terminal FtsZ-binding domain-containing protein [Sulfuricella sp.]|nr:cell division protein ZipA C-terminal FtsZ-binding domain-containing protein [Sulfuricella sp.]